MPDSPLLPFAEQYRELVKPAFGTRVDNDLATGVDLVAQARDYATRGKPEFVIAYLVALPANEMGEDEKRELLAQAFEQRADQTDALAARYDAEYHRPFPLMGIEANRDRQRARQVRQGKMIKPYAKAPKPLDMQQ